MRLSKQQLEELGPFVKDQSILDLGAGELEGSEMLLELGARDVLAVDARAMPEPSSSRISTRCCQFHQLRETRPVVFASWVVNWPVNLEPLLDAAKVIISLSKNTDGSACGYPGMWALLSRREVLRYIPERPNTLTVYGPEIEKRPLTGEEFAALYQERVYSFEEAEKATKKCVGEFGL